MQLIKVSIINDDGQYKDLVINATKISSLEDTVYRGQKVIHCQMGSRYLFIQFSGRVEHFVESLKQSIADRTLAACARKRKEHEDTYHDGELAIEGTEWLRL